MTESRPLDPRLVDSARAEEIELVARLFVITCHQNRQLTQAAIDEALGVEDLLPTVGCVPTPPPRMDGAPIEADAQGPLLQE
jgi:hypothetical protein